MVEKKLHSHGCNMLLAAGCRLLAAGCVHNVHEENDVRFERKTNHTIVANVGSGDKKAAKVKMTISKERGRDAKIPG